VSLGKLGPFAKEAAPALKAAAGNPRFAARVQAAMAVWRITGETQTANDVLLQEIQTPDAPWEAADAIGELGVQAREMVPRLTELLRAERAETRLHAASALGNIGPPAQAAIADLKRLLKRRGYRRSRRGRSSHRPHPKTMST